MRRLQADDSAKGWFLGPWNSNLAVSVGFANQGVDEPHRHERITEIYLVARGSASIRVESETVLLKPGDAILVEPGEAHTFLESSDDYLHFVVHAPGFAGEEAEAEKRSVSRAELGL